MARIVPDGWTSLEGPSQGPGSAARRELDTLRELGAALSSDSTVYHGVHWTRLEQGFSVYGEVDFIVVGPGGRVLLIEQRSGFLDETPEGLVRTVAGRSRSVKASLLRSVEALRARFSQAHQGRLRLSIDYLLYLPDYQVKNPATAGLAPERIVDARRRGEFVRVVREAVNDPGRGKPAADVPVTRGRVAPRPVQSVLDLPDTGADDPTLPAAAPADVHRFLSDTLDLVPDVSALIGRADAWTTRLSGGLAEWARKLDFEPFRLRVKGTAGSGKTQLALAVLRDASAAGLRALYVCYNRPLADHVAELAPPGATVATFHMLGDRRLKAQGQSPDFEQADVFGRFEQAMLQYPPRAEECVGVLVVDEGQDFQPDWAEAVLAHLRPGGRAWWLEDPMQNLYGREPVPLPGWTVLRADTNYRTPRDILRDVQTLIDVEVAQSASPILGDGVDVHVYEDAAGMVERTKRAITEALRLGYKRNEIAVLTFRGREGSALMQMDALGPHRLRRFTGRYDLFGQPVFREGDLLVETLFRFKGQAAPCVILSEIDFDALDERAIRRVFVGATRATMRLSLVMSQRAAALTGADRLKGDAP